MSSAPSWIRRFSEPEYDQRTKDSGMPSRYSSSPMASRNGSSTYLDRTEENISDAGRSQFPRSSSGYLSGNSPTGYQTNTTGRIGRRDRETPSGYASNNNGYVSDTEMSSRYQDSGDELDSETSSRYIPRAHGQPRNTRQHMYNGQRRKSPNPRHHAPRPERNTRGLETKREESWSYIDSGDYSEPSLRTSNSYGDFEGSGSTASGSTYVPRSRNVHSAPPSTLEKAERNRRRNHRGDYSDEAHTSGYSTNSLSEMSEFNNTYRNGDYNNRLPVPDRRYSREHDRYMYHQNERSPNRNHRDAKLPQRPARSSDEKLSHNHKRSDSKLSMNESDISLSSRERTRKSAEKDKERNGSTLDLKRQNNKASSVDLKSPSRSSTLDSKGQNDNTTLKTQKAPTIGNVAVTVTNNIQYDPNDPFSFIQPVDVPFNVKLRKCVGPLMAVVLVLVLAAALGAAIYFASALKETQEKQIDLLRANLALKIRKTGYVQNIEALTDKDFSFLSFTYCKQMDIFYSGSRFRDTYRGCEVLSIKNHFINFTLFFVEKEATSSQIIGVIETSAKRVANESTDLALVDKFQIELNSVKVTMERRMEPETFNKKSLEQMPKSKKPPPVKPATTKPFATVKPEVNDLVTSTDIKKTKPTKGATTIKTPIQLAGKKKIPPENKPVYSWDPCKDWEGMYFPHPTKCNRFFQCSNGVTIEKNCSKDLLWHWKERICVSKFVPNVLCPDASKAPPRPTTTTTTTTTTTEPTTVSDAATTSTDDYYDESWSTTTTDTLETTTSINVPNGVSLTAVAGKYEGRRKYPADPCKSGNTGALHGHPTDCGMFIQCANKQVLNVSCAPKLVFDPDSTACIHADVDLVCPDIKPCKQKDDGYFSHPYDCTKYIQCQHKTESVRNCKPGLYWNQKVKGCMHRTTNTVCPLES